MNDEDIQREQFEATKRALQEQAQALAARAEENAAHEACKAWLKTPGSKNATPWGHFLRGWRAHREWLEQRARR